MSKYCPRIDEMVTYMVCSECENRLCDKLKFRINSTESIADYVLTLVKKQRKNITNLQLNTILYLVMETFSNTNHKIFEINEIRWIDKYIPIIPVIYEKYKDYGHNPIPVNSIDLNDTAILSKKEEKTIMTIVNGVLSK